MGQFEEFRIQNIDFVTKLNSGSLSKNVMIEIASAFEKGLAMT